MAGWQVLEPWVTPSMFYRALGKKKDEGVYFDMYGFCEALGPEEGNKVLQAHWDRFYTSEDFHHLADRGVNMVRVPIGDWVLDPYGPYVGCTDGAAAEVDMMLDSLAHWNISALFDLHGLRGSQNGLDSSGSARDIVWDGDFKFSHWDHQSANWMSQYNSTTKEQGNFNFFHLKRGLKVSEQIL